MFLDLTMDARCPRFALGDCSQESDGLEQKQIQDRYTQMSATGGEVCTRFSMTPETGPQTRSARLYGMGCMAYP